MSDDSIEALSRLGVKICPSCSNPYQDSNPRYGVETWRDDLKAHHSLNENTFGGHLSPPVVHWTCSEACADRYLWHLVRNYDVVGAQYRKKILMRPP